VVRRWAHQAIWPVVTSLSKNAVRCVDSCRVAGAGKVGGRPSRHPTASSAATTRPEIHDGFHPGFLPRRDQSRKKVESVKQDSSIKNAVTMFGRTGRGRGGFVGWSRDAM